MITDGNETGLELRRPRRGWGKDDETIGLLDLEQGDIRVAATWTKLLPRAALAKKLHQAVRHARLSLAKAQT